MKPDGMFSQGHTPEAAWWDFAQVDSGQALPDIYDSMVMSDTLESAEGIVSPYSESQQGYPAYSAEVEREAWAELLMHYQDDGKTDAAFNEALRVARGRGLSLHYATQLVRRGWTLESITAKDEEVRAHPAGDYLQDYDDDQQQEAQG